MTAPVIPNLYSVFLRAILMAFTVEVFIVTLILIGGIYSFLQKKYLLGSILVFFPIAAVLYYLTIRFLL
jgi:hypothetical protein